MVRIHRAVSDRGAVRLGDLDGAQMSGGYSPHLQAMGIQQWVRRDRVPSETAVESAPSDAVEVVDFTAQIRRQGQVDSPLMLITTELDRSGEQLLSAMLYAIEVDAAQCHRLVVLDPELFSDDAFQPFLLQQIEASASVAQLQLGGERVDSGFCFYTPHPAELLAHPQRKRAAWETLKLLHTRICKAI